MLKPPFTVLILKNSRQPVTVRITTGMVVFFVAVIGIIGALSGSLLTYYLTGKAIPVDSTVKQPADDASFVEIATQNSTGADGSLSISDHEILMKHNEASGLSLLLDCGGQTGELYVWLIVNDDADHVSERHILPRNPLLGGIPVDYRNGIPCPPGLREIRAEFEEPPPVSISSVRVLVYAGDGGVLTDKRYKDADAARL